MARPAEVLLSWYRRERSAHPPAVEAPSPAGVAHALANLGPDGLADSLVEFLAPVIDPFAFEPLIRRHVRWLRHGLNHLTHASDPLIFRVERCAVPDGTYAQPGLGVMAWGNLARLAEPDLLPWTPSRAEGFAALDACDPARRAPVELWADANRWARQAGRDHPEFTPADLARFLDLVAAMRGRELFPVPGEASADVWADLLREVRSRTPLRQRVKQADAGRRTPSDVVAEWAGRRELPEGVAALTLAHLGSDPLGPIDAELLAAWEGSSPGRALGLELVVLAQSADSTRYPRLDGEARAALAELAGGPIDAACPLETYRTAWLMASGLAERWRAHIGEAAEVLTAARRGRSFVPVAGEFPGLSGDGFRLLAELHTQPPAWFASQRDRYRYGLQEPMALLGAELVERFLRPVVHDGLGERLELEVRPGRALTRTGHNYFGRGGGYSPEIALHFQPEGKPRHSALRFFVRVGIDGLSWGVEWASRSRGAVRRFRQRLQEHGDLLAMLLVSRLDGGELATVEGGVPRPMRREADLRAWAAEPMRSVERFSPPDEGLWRREEWAGEIILTWGRLLPLFLFANADDPVAALEKAYPRASTGRDLRHKFAETTHLPAGWLDRAVDLLKVRRQLILRGVPGTGKTHVARELADYLAGGDPTAVRLVQFHPNFGYEDFVEGIRARSVEGADGRSEIRYPVEDGVLTAFVAEACRRPEVPHVLVVDEINRGNLPKIFGELLYLLEYREQSLTLPYSRRAFQLPGNLYLIGTMNEADRSVAALDQALRRRFHFLDMPPDAAVLARWLERRTSRPEALSRDVLALFEELNARLEASAGPLARVGHCYFMLDDLDESRLDAAWTHHVRPQVEAWLPPGQDGEFRDWRALLKKRRREREPKI